MNTCVCILSAYTQIPEGWLVSGTGAGTNSRCAFKIFSFVGISKLSSEMVAPVFSLRFSPEDACVTVEITSSSSSEAWSAIDRPGKLAVRTPFLKIYAAIILSHSYEVTTS